MVFAIRFMISINDAKGMSYPRWVSYRAMREMSNIELLFSSGKSNQSNNSSLENIRKFGRNKGRHLLRRNRAMTAHIDMKIEREANVEEIQIEVWVRQIQEHTNRISPSEICQTCLLLNTWHFLPTQCNRRRDQQNSNANWSQSPNPCSPRSRAYNMPNIKITEITKTSRI